jgi:hypothetical protein
MKKILFSGCSFMAGDELVWEQFQKEYGKELRPWHWKQPNYDEVIFRFEYRKYRKRFNLPAVVSGISGCDWVDISGDGKSNTGITLETISYLNNCSKEERQQFHVIIGWTCISRILKYSPSQKHFLNLSAQHYSDRTEDPNKEALKEHIKTQILSGDDQDFILDYIKNVMFLENYLISNNISYTFYRAHDESLYNFKNIGPFDYTSPYGSPLTLKVEDCTNHNNWYKFDDQHLTPVNGIGWNMLFLDKPDQWVSPINGHPGILAVNDFSAKLSDFVNKQISS